MLVVGVCQCSLVFIKVVKLSSLDIVGSNELNRNITRCEHAVDMIGILMEPVRHLNVMFLTKKVAHNKMKILVVENSLVPSVYLVILSRENIKVRGRGKLGKVVNGSPGFVLLSCSRQLVPM